MEKYLGVKIIHAEPMNSHTFISKVKNEDIPQNSIPSDGYKVIYEDGYVSWSPMEAFEKAYRPIENLTFGLAVEALKQGKKVARAGWNDKGMFVFLKTGKFQEKSDNAIIESLIQKNLCGGISTAVPILDSICMKTADNKILIGWLASQTDILAEDWEIVE